MLQISFFLLPAVMAYVNSACQELGDFDPTKEFYPVETGVQSPAVTIYEYDLVVPRDADSLTSDYKQYPVIDNFFVSRINFQATPSWSTESSSLQYEVYDREIPELYVVEVTGYFRAPETGYFEFEFDTSNGAFLEFGPGELRCQDVDKGGRKGFYMDSVKKRRNGVQGGGDFGLHFSNWCFSRGVYYPVRIVLYNTGGISSLNLKVKLPSGSVLHDLGPELFQATFECPTYPPLV